MVLSVSLWLGTMIDIKFWKLYNIKEKVQLMIVYQQFVTNQNSKHSKMDKNDDEEFYGINKKLYTKKQKEEPLFKNITNCVFLPGQPQLNAPNDAYQPVQIPKQNIMEETLRKQVEYMIYSQTFLNIIVYDSKDPSPYTREIDPSTYGIDMLPYYIPKDKEDVTLVFQSRFQCGNLRRVTQKSEYEYNLILSTDYETSGHTQWYYFSVANTRKNVQYRFNIINLLKPDSLYNVGMKPIIYSQKNAKQRNYGWHRDGNDICYYTSNIKRKNGGFYSCLTFTLKFQHDFDNVYIAHCYPYTYTQLQKFLRGLEQDPVKKNRFQRKFLCLTEAGNNCDYLTIGEYGTNLKQKKAIVLTSRVHPGETMASYIIEYIIQFLLSNHPTAKYLRDNFVFKIVPMLNIDGVIVGNYRCNLSGSDLNRQWIEPSKKSHPTIYFTKILIKKLKQERQLGFCCDIHGHSRKKNIFIYGCSDKNNTKKEQVFPLMMKNNCAVFSFKDCCFMVQKDREGAARIALWKQLNIINCFTLQLSFCGSDFGKYEYYHFNINIYRDIAHAFCQSLQEYYEPSQTKYKKAMEQLENISKNVKNEQGQKKDTIDSDYSGEEQEVAQKEKQKKTSVQGRQPRETTAQKQAILKKKLAVSIKPKKK